MFIWFYVGWGCLIYLLLFYCNGGIVNLVVYVRVNFWCVYCSVFLIICLMFKVVEFNIKVLVVGISGVIVWLWLWLLCFLILVKRCLKLILKFFFCNCSMWWCVCFFEEVLRKIFIGVLGNIIVFMLWLLVIRFGNLWNVCWWCNNVLWMCGNVVICEVVFVIFWVWILLLIFFFLRIIFRLLLVDIKCIFRWDVSGISVFFDVILIWWCNVVNVSMW